MVSTTLGLQAEDIKCIDVSGTWVTTEDIDNSDCGAPNKTKQYNVTFGDTLNMATGIGDVEPRRFTSYVEEDSAAIAINIIAAKSTKEKVKLIATIGNYPWGPVGFKSPFLKLDTIVESTTFWRTEWVCNGFV